MIILILLLAYILPILLSFILIVVNYKLLYEGPATIEEAYEFYYNHDKFTDVEQFVGTSHYLNCFLFVPLINIGTMFYFLISAIYNYIKNMKI